MTCIHLTITADEALEQLCTEDLVRELRARAKNKDLVAAAAVCGDERFAARAIEHALHLLERRLVIEAEGALHDTLAVIR
jgi:hypothetical protein